MWEKSERETDRRMRQTGMRKKMYRVESRVVSGFHATGEERKKEKKAKV